MRYRTVPLLRAGVCLATLALLAACASQAPRSSATQEAAGYRAHAQRSYVPPGPPDDPWGPYIREASTRFDVPMLWIRSVMHVESGGKQYINGELTTSPVGAMGLMQVMPGTYDELRQRYNLGSDPYNPYNNIMAGTAYMREMYDVYGSPGFLAAYNAGPYRLDDYLANNRPLPDETRRYVAMIGPEIEGVEPGHRSPAEQYAMNALPIDIPPGMRYGGAQQFASRAGGSLRLAAPRQVQAANLPPPRPAPYVAPQQYALVTPPPPPPPPSRGFRFIARANAEPAPIWRGGPRTGEWGIQVGAYDREGQARVALGLAKNQARIDLAAAHGIVTSVHASHGVLWRARLTGLSQETAVDACGKLSHTRLGCIVLSPQSQM